MKRLALVIAALGTGCTVYVEPSRPAPERVVYAPEPPPPVYESPAPVEVVSINVEFPIGQPAPIACPWAPPPIMVDPPPPPPFGEAIWTGGFWVWHGTWVWVHGRWAAPPEPGYHWNPPYYEHRNGLVVFITGHWGRPGVVFLPPPRSASILVVTANPGVVRGPAPIGPQGVFIPPPPGSRHGIIIPAPVGTAPSVVTSAPPVINVGMHIEHNVTNITNVTVIAPSSATATGRAVNASVPAQAHLAAAMPSVVHVPAPTPASAAPIQTFQPGKPSVPLPPPQTVHSVVPPTLQRTAPLPADHPVPASTLAPTVHSDPVLAPSPATENHPAGPLIRETVTPTPQPKITTPTAPAVHKPLAPAPATVLHKPSAQAFGGAHSSAPALGPKTQPAPPTGIKPSVRLSKTPVPTTKKKILLPEEQTKGKTTTE